MKLYTIYDQSTGKIVKTVCCQEKDISAQIGSGQSFIKGKYDDDKYYIKNSTPISFSNKPSQLHTWDYSTDKWVESLDVIKENALEKVLLGYEQICNGKDPTTGKDIYVDCVVGKTTYRMNAGKEAAAKMDGGVRIFERMGAATMPVVRDFNNVNHVGVPLADAISISIQQGSDALAHWQQKGAFVDAINAATTVADIQAIDIKYSVKIVNEIIAKT